MSEIMLGLDQGMLASLECDQRRAGFGRRTMSDVRDKVTALRCWRGPVAPEPVGGGITNRNFLVADAGARYFGGLPSERLLRSYRAMKCASLLREAMWSMVSEIHSTLDFDFPAYTAENLERFERAWAEFRS
jgi:hypothetical protein